MLTKSKIGLAVNVRVHPEYEVISTTARAGMQPLSFQRSRTNQYNGKKAHAVRLLLSYI